MRFKRQTFFSIKIAK